MKPIESRKSEIQEAIVSQKNGISVSKYKDKVIEILNNTINQLDLITMLNYWRIHILFKDIWNIYKN